jgi:hypothetical protein
VSDFAGFRRSLPAVRVAFFSDEQLLVLARRGEAFELRLEPVRGGAAVWTRPIPPMIEPELFVDGTGRWSVVGGAPSRAERLMVTAVGGGAMLRIAARAKGQVILVFPLGENLLAFDRRSGSSFSLGWQNPRRWDVRLVGPRGERQLGTLRGLPTCFAPDGAGVLCQESAAGANRGMLWSIDGTGEMRQVGFAPVDLFEERLRGGVLGAARSAGDAILVDTRAREGIRLSSPAFTYVQAVHPVPGGAVVHHYAGGVPRVTVFRIAGQPTPRR